MKDETASLLLGIGIGFVLGVMVALWLAVGPPFDSTPAPVEHYVRAN